MRFLGYRPWILTDFFDEQFDSYRDERDLLVISSICRLEKVETKGTSAASMGLVLLMAAKWADQENRFQLSARVISGTLGFSTRRTKGAVSGLIRAGVIERHPSASWMQLQNQTCSYRIRLMESDVFSLEGRWHLGREYGMTDDEIEQILGPPPVEIAIPLA